MPGGQRLFGIKPRTLGKLRIVFFVFLAFLFVRFTKGSGFSDAYAFLTRPLWPGHSQREWIQTAHEFETDTRIRLLEEDNQRLRAMLEIQSSSDQEILSASVVSRNSQDWWQQIILSKGGLQGINQGDAVLGPGGLLGIVESITPSTSRVRLLTDPGSQVGVWVPRTQRHGILTGIGTNRPLLVFFDSDASSVAGDVVSTSPASTIVPPNIPVGIIQSIDLKDLPYPTASVQLTASPEAIDWVQIK